MPCSHRKSLARCKAKMRLRCSTSRNFFDVYLWHTRYQMAKQSGDGSARTMGLCQLMPTWWDDEADKEVVTPKLGEIHFVSRRWTTEIVAHELCHAILQRMRLVRPFAQQVMDQEGDSEEDICYEFGEWFDSVYRWLWETDKHGKHAS